MKFLMMLCLILSQSVSAKDQSFLDSLAIGHPFLSSWRKQLNAKKIIVSELEQKSESLLNNSPAKKVLAIDGINLNLGLGLSGKVGLLTFGGNSFSEMFWHKKPIPVAKEAVDDEVLIDEYDGLIQDYQELKSVIHQSALDYGLEEQQAQELDITSAYLAMERFHALSEKLVANQSWKIDRLAFDLEISFSVTPGAVIVTAGGDARIRLTWKANKQNQKSLALKEIEHTDPLCLGELQDKAFKSLQQIEEHGFKLTYLRLGLAVSAGGNLGVVEAKLQSVAYIYLVPEKNNKELMATKSRSKGCNPWSRPLTKALAKAEKLSKRMHKQIADNAKNMPKRWGLKTVRVFFEATAAGTVAPVGLQGAPNVEINFENKNWPKATALKTNAPSDQASHWQLKAMRLRQRLKAGVALGTVAKLEARPFIEWHLVR